MQVVWSEIITPQGVNILLTDASNADIVGKSGMLGKTNNKYWERYGLALTLSTLVNAITLTIAELKYKDHKLKGNYKDFRECHIKSNLLLIYHK